MNGHEPNEAHKKHPRHSYRTIEKNEFGRINENMLDRGKKDARIGRESVHSDEQYKQMTGNYTNNNRKNDEFVHKTVEEHSACYEQKRPFDSSVPDSKGKSNWGKECEF